MRYFTRKRIITGSALILAVLITAFSLDYYFTGLHKAPEPDNNYIPEPRVEYGIVVDSFQVIKDEVKANENLSTILLQYNLNMGIIEQLVQKAAGIFDVRKIKVGNKYTVLLANDSVPTAHYFIYESSPTQYVIFEAGDSIHVHAGEKEIVKKIKTASGTITSSLWNAMSDMNADPNLTIALSEIFAWSIDFYAIQKGDNFTAIYEQLFVEGEPIGLGNIVSARFYHNGKNNYAFRFVQDDKVDYFDDKGQSVRKAFLKAPLKFSRISSRFTNARFHPVLRIMRPHHGVDYAAPKGTPVHSIGNGTVTDVRYAGGAGRMVKIRHNSTYSTSYMHLSGYGPGIHAGSHVQQGQVIGYVGSSGLSTGPHLDFRFYKNGTPVDPLKVESPPSLPVKKELLGEFNKVRYEMGRQLDSLNIPQKASLMPL
ncbi:MAG: peptidoglycan DD-metalloendopeptidase family protein [Chloroflexota bacterium]|nr:peptidoglycan DD-metalloendopeptidase family protein [Lentimicrobium sp.]